MVQGIGMQTENYRRCISLSSTRTRKRQLSQKGALLLLIVMFAVIAVTTFVLVMIFGAPKSKYPKRDSLQSETMATTEVPTQPTTEEPTDPPPLVSYPDQAETFQQLDAQLDCEHAFLLDCETNEILACKGEADERIYPASMTKIMTIAIAAEHIENWDDTFTFTNEMIAPLVEAGASRAKFSAGEEVTMRDLLYGAALPSGADATVALAIVTAGSEEEFVQWMNDKVEELGLVNTHFVNTSGLHDEQHYSTVTDIALIMEYALMNDMAREVLSTAEYMTEKTEQHPDGILLTSTMFNKMYGNEVQGITILGGKTGFTDEAGQCLASYAELPNGHRYIAVTSFGGTKWQPVFDSFKLYGIVTGTYPMEDAGGTGDSAAEPAA